MEINNETQELYWLMYDIVSRKQTEDKMLIFDAAKSMISAIDEQGNLPTGY